MRRLASPTLLMVLLLGFAPPAAAQDEARGKLASRLFEVFQAREMIERQADALMKSQIDAIGAIGQRSGMPAGEIKKLETLTSDMRELMAAEIGWDAIVKDATLIYAQIFSEEELQAMIAFFETPAGRAWIETSPEVMARMMRIVQGRMVSIMPRMLELIKKRMQPQ